MLPAYPWQQRPDDYPLTAEEVCAALAENGGSITRASLRLKVGSLVLRKFVERSARARAVIQEMKDRLADKAAEKLEEALEDPDARRQDWAIRYVLNSKNARRLGWGSQENADDAARVQGPLVNLVMPPIQWGDGTVIGPREAAKQLIDLAPATGKTGDGSSSD
jgi:hypothetical protein